MVKMESTRTHLLGSKIEDEERYLQALRVLDETVVELRDLKTEAKIVGQLKDELVGLLE